MQTLTEIVAAVVAHSSAVAYSHFGVTLEAQPVEKPVPAERTVARSAAPPQVPAAKVIVRPGKTAARVEECPDQRARLIRA